MSAQCTEIIRTFFANTSLRGFNRIVKTDSLFLKFLWILFVVSTLTFLVVSVFKVVTDYKQYSVNIQTYIQIDNATPFPAVTFCNHQPFSQTAYKLWNESKVLSPTKFNQLLRLSALEKFKELFKENSYPKDFIEPIFLSVFLDKISIYYQSLHINVTTQLGHDKSIIKNCMWSYDQIMAFDNQCQDEMLQVKSFSHPLYFNCHTVEPKPEFVSLVSKLGLIIWLGPDENTDIQYRQGFLFDIFEQAYGLRVVIHEPGSYPNIESQGIQIEPGRLNELSYQPVVHVKVDTDRKPCINEPTIMFKDLENYFKYDIDLCFNMALQDLLIKRCKCIYVYFPRYVDPNKELPYCGSFDQDKLSELTTRRSCIRKIFEEAVSLKIFLKTTKKCTHRCKTIEYETTTSVTKWRPTDWQFYWLKEIVSRWESFASFYMNLLNHEHKFSSVNITKVNFAKLSKYKSGIEDFLLRINLSNLIPPHEKLTFNERYTFIVIKRKANNTFIKEERLVLTFNALVSRVGGLCSLYIGLTFAFFIELIDFLYTILFLRNKMDAKENKNNKYKEKIITFENKMSKESKHLKIENEQNSTIQVPVYSNIYSSNECFNDSKKEENVNSCESFTDDHSKEYLKSSNPWIPLKNQIV